ncbi:MAG: septum formation inhibitor Maf [Clostridia bacterium]|nr:septum formation inhibitor Maf [Clostridia bacterium]
MSEIILASASPRRKELLLLAGIDFVVKVADVDEVIDPSLTPDGVVMSLAKQKAQAVASENPDSLVIGADTVVVLDGKILGKPKSEENAVELLTMLSGRVHTVYTGVALIKGETVKTFCEATQVEFYPLTDEEIKAYVATKEPMDKAGAYGIQGKGCILIRKIDGDYFNVVGLPVSAVYRELRDFDV